MEQDNQANESVDTAVTAGGSYDIIRQRLLEQGDVLDQKVGAFNKARSDAFGSTDLIVAGRSRVRTENNCLGRDIVQVGKYLIFGYNVFIGLKKSTKIEDVFSVYTLQKKEDVYSLEPVDITTSFFADSKFRHDFDELYRYYKETQLVQLVIKEGKLLAGFKIGERLDDLRVFRWSVSADMESVTYIDNRGERELDLPERHDFEWVETQREDIVQGRFPHVNISDTVFVETIGGDLTVKIENNSETGEGIFSEPVDEVNQSINDANIAYAKVGELLLIKVQPYKEDDWRYLLFNPLNTEVRRIDSIGDSCVSLPEDHGVIFPDGLYLETGEYKSFGIELAGLQFKRRIRSPNGEDMLFVFYEPFSGTFALLPYNLISKTLQNPIVTHGYAVAEDGTAVVFTAGEEPTRMHPMQIWQTPFCSIEYASSTPDDSSFFTRIGNAELVRGVSDLYSVSRLIRSNTVSARHYELLSKASNRLFDDHYWLGDAETQGIDATIKQISNTVELIVDEFEKVESIRSHSAAEMRKAIEEQNVIVSQISNASMESVSDYVDALDSLRRQRGHLTTIRDYRYIDLDKLKEMDDELVDLNDTLSDRTANFLSNDSALEPYHSEIAELDERLPKHTKVADLDPDLESLEDIAGGLDLLSELIASLKVDDATVQTNIVDSISAVYSKLNQSRARGKQLRKDMGSAEAIGQFSAQFKLFSQSIANALGLATDPDRCDTQLTRLLVQLEELESQFSEHEQFLADILDKREDIHDTFTAHKQQLIDAQQSRAQTLSDAVNRMLGNIENRAQRFSEVDELNTYMASDTLVLKVHDIVNQLRELDSAVKADDAEARLKMIRDMAVRSLRDKSDLYSDDGNTISLGPRHKFSVNNEGLDLTIIPRQEGLALHLVGTQFFEPIENERLNALKPYWNLTLTSETDEVYRSEYLAYQFIQSVRNGEHELDWPTLVNSASDVNALDEHLRKYATARYREGYQKGVHDADAAAIIKVVVPLMHNGDLLQFSPEARGLAHLFWHATSVNQDPIDNESIKSLQARARSATKMYSVLNDRSAMQLIEQELQREFNAWLKQHEFTLKPQVAIQATAYLVSELGRDSIKFVRSRQAKKLANALDAILHADVSKELQTTLHELADRPGQQWTLAQAWLQACFAGHELQVLNRYYAEAAVGLIATDITQSRDLDIDVEVSVKNLFGEHNRIANAELRLTLDEFLSRLDHHCRHVATGYAEFLSLRHQIAEESRAELRLEEFKPKPLSSFVRNKLINDAYLPLIGDNLAKQIGTVGENKRSDLNGLLMMISPPGYGKTTLMEYVASRMGMTFMKINCPSLSHDVASLDPGTAPNATAAQELKKLNLALEMGDNVMLYLDDIQHTGPEFLQKFISLCDSTRRIDGIWKGRTKTYDMRGRKFCVVMAGNPYTESGESFKIPDMLANRADIYNLGDVLSGKETQFELSYIENCLSSNAVLAPLATRDMQDVYKLIDIARGRNVPTTDLSHVYSAAEINEITAVFQKLFVVQETVLAVNKQYIASAAQEDKYRVEPRFLLQGSYRNMNKLAEKISAVMNEKELDELINDHYRGEAQLLTQGTEANLLMLKALREKLSDEETQRWEEIKVDFLRNKAMGGDSTDAGQRIVAQLVDLVDGVDMLNNQLKSDVGLKIQMKQQARSAKLLYASLAQLNESVKQQKQPKVAITNTPSAEFAQVLNTLTETIEHTLFPLVRSMDNRISQDVDAHRELRRLSEEVLQLKKNAGSP